jgi:hypothetical protein
MESITQSFKKLTRKIYPKSKKSRSRSHKSSRSNSNSRSRSHSRSSIHSPNSTGKRELSRKIKKAYKKLDISNLAKEVDSLQSKTKLTFTKKNKRKSSPSSPIVLTIRNLDTGKKKEATVVKNLNTGKYDFYDL